MVPPASRAARARALGRRLTAETRARMDGHDLSLASAGAALYGALCVVPSVLVAVSLAQLVLGREALQRYGGALADALPTAIGADQAAHRVLDAGVTLGPFGVVLAVGMGSAYGEGLSRALARFAPVDPDAVPARLEWRAAFVGAVVTGAFVSGFLQGFLLFCSLPIDLARPFGGLAGVGVACALLLWLWVLHAVVLVGYAFTWAVHAVLRGEDLQHRVRLDGDPRPGPPVPAGGHSPVP